MDKHEAHTQLLNNIIDRLDELEELLHKHDPNSDPTHPPRSVDPFYRFYHGSFKVFHFQSATEEIVVALKELKPDEWDPPPHRMWNDDREEYVDNHELDPDFHPLFAEIINEGTGKEFTQEVNRHWGEETRPIVEAYFHAQQMLRLAIRSGHELEEYADQAPQMLPSCWAAVLHLFRMR